VCSRCVHDPEPNTYGPLEWWPRLSQNRSVTSKREKPMRLEICMSICQNIEWAVFTQPAKNHCENHQRWYEWCGQNIRRKFSWGYQKAWVWILAVERRRENFLTYRETSISKVQCVSRVFTVIGCHKLWLVRILEKSVTLILTVR